MTENEDHPFKVLTLNHGKYIRLPETASGYYFRRVCHDGAITFLPVKMPISCQGMTPLGGTEK